MTYSEIRNKYRHPIRAILASGYREDEYCVGGALCLEAGIDRSGCNFPTSEEVQRAILKLNPRIDKNLLTDADYEKFRSNCEKILALNDIGQFSSSWEVVKDLLQWKPKLQSIDDLPE